MPLIMEESIDVDDLFGDPSSLELGLPAPQPIKGLAQRIDEMHLLGCCQKLTWSRLGCIAYISQDGLRVNVRHLVCRPSDGKWVLSNDYPLNPVTDAHGGHPLAHLSWNETGAELAVVDTAGRVSIFSISIALNNITTHRQAILDPADDGAQVVGMMWLNTQRSVHAFHQAARLNGRWGYSPFRRRPIGPFHPVGKIGLLCVTRSGVIRLLYQNPDHRWTEISTELKTIGHSDRLLTHAALLATPGGILVATHSACQKINLYRVHIAWNPAQWDQNQPKQASAAHPFPTPSFRIFHSKIENSSSIFTPSGSSSDESKEFSPGQSSLYSLTHLDLVPGQSDSTGGSSSGPWVLAVYSNPVHATGHDPQQQASPSSVIVRWQVENTSLALHPKFDEVISKKNNFQAKPKTELRRLDDIYSDRYIISIDHIEFGNVLAVTYDDSSISFFEPKTMAKFNGVDDTNTVTSMVQAGFQFPLDTSGVHVSFSPNSCLAVVLDGEWQVQLRLMEHTFGVEEGLYDESKFSAAVAALALAFCRGCGSDINTDDILMIILRQLTPDAQNAFINEVYRALPINCNFTTEQDKLMNHPYIPRCLSIQAALGFKNYYTPRSLPSSVSWAILHLRHASVVFAYFFQYNKGPKDSEPHDPDVLKTVLGNTKWALDFSYYILDEIFELADEFESVFSDQEAFAQKVKSTNSLALILLLSSMSRAFLRFICRGLRGVYAGYTTSTLSGDARIYYSELFQTLDTSPIRIDAYEKFLAGVDSVMRHTYLGAGFGDNERPAPEKELLVNSRIPAVLVPAVATLLRQQVPLLKPDINRMAIYLADYSWLGVCNDRRTEFYRRTRQVDILKKLPLRSFNPHDYTEPDGGNTGKEKVQHGQPRRRCARCCEVSGDVTTPRSFLSYRLIAKLQLLRSCLCGGMWTIESGTSSTADHQTPRQNLAYRENGDTNGAGPVFGTSG